MARAAGYPVTLDPFLARPLSFYDYDGEVASLLLEVRGRGTALLDQASTIEVTAPLGKGFRFEPGLGRAALLGGGIGVAPLKVLSRRLDAMASPRRFPRFATQGRRPSPGSSQTERATMDGSVAPTYRPRCRSTLQTTAIYRAGPTQLAAVKLAAACRLLPASGERMGAGRLVHRCFVPVRGGGYVRSFVGTVSRRSVGGSADSGVDLSVELCGIPLGRP